MQSDTAKRMGRKIEAAPDVIANLKRLCVGVLEPARVALGKPLTISSGYRPDWLNAAVPGSSSKSAHLFGRAADVEVEGMAPLAVAKAVAALKLPELDQLIFEFGSWVHLAVAAQGKPARGQILHSVSSKGETVYLNGLE